MTRATVAPTCRVFATRRFAEDVKQLQDRIVRKLENMVDEVRRFGPRHPPLHTRQIERNPNRKYHFMNVDDQYRAVVVLEGDVVLFEKVGNHDATLAWGARATLREYEERLEIEGVLRPRVKARATQPEAPQLIETEVTLTQIVEHQEALSDLITGDLFGSLKGYRDGSIEDWMIFLSPVQRRAVSRAISGPARVTGGPGTGKTVVGLHRAVDFARNAEGRRVLVTSYVRNVPEVLGGLAERLSPELYQRMEFRTLHSLAGRILAQRGRPLTVKEDAAESRFRTRLAADPARREALRRAGFGPDYLWEEIERVIEGREVDGLETYLALARHGRRQRMGSQERRAVWQLYEEYRAACDNHSPPTVSWSRLLSEARRALADEPQRQPYAAIVVDEAQDITECGMRLLLDVLDGHDRGQLLLIGDSAQRIYAGGFRLADLGLEVRGRSFALSICYRSTDEIMKAATALSRFISTEEDDWSQSGSWLPVRTGARPMLREFSSSDEERRATIALLQAEPDLVDSTAVLLRTNPLSDAWRAVIRDAGIPVCDLVSYSGRPKPGVKVGTYNRSKGLEFKRVIVPELSAASFRADPDQLDDFIARGTALFVALTRARDRLDLSYTGEPSLFVEPLLPHIDVG